MESKLFYLVNELIRNRTHMCIVTISITNNNKADIEMIQLQNKRPVRDLTSI